MTQETVAEVVQSGSVGLGEDVYEKSTLYLLVSLLCFSGVIIPVPLGPFAFFISAGLLVLARENYVWSLQKGQDETLRWKFVLTMAMCLGNMFAIVIITVLLVISLYITLNHPMLFENFSKSSPER